MVMEFLNHLVRVFQDYFGVFDEERIRFVSLLGFTVAITLSLCTSFSTR